MTKKRSLPPPTRQDDVDIRYVGKPAPAGPVRRDTMEVEMSWLEPEESDEPEKPARGSSREPTLRRETVVRRAPAASPAPRRSNPKMAATKPEPAPTAKRAEARVVVVKKPAAAEKAASGKAATKPKDAEEDLSPREPPRLSEAGAESGKAGRARFAPAIPREEVASIPPPRRNSKPPRR
jgi:hypothetical protein